MDGAQTPRVETRSDDKPAAALSSLMAAAATPRDLQAADMPVADSRRSKQPAMLGDADFGEHFLSRRRGAVMVEQIEARGSVQ